ncbi:family 43 glycosylhydrolase [Candidatus Bathyarchaeota archaeon]|nr:family 43 glycosylhydrolase [Candidatus Bathyarchaeota archaeon]
MAAINPIIPGFAPDPSVVKVGEWYYLVNSTFHLFPGLPIYASQDLVSWKHIGKVHLSPSQATSSTNKLPGNAINRPEQLRLTQSRTNLVQLDNDAREVMLATGGLYAPTIRFHEGTFYIVCTNVMHLADTTRPENFVISTTDILANTWSDPVYFDFDGIDPSLLFDEGKVYVQGSRGPGPATTINQFELDLATGAKGDERTIWRGTGGIYPEGPHLYRRGEWYYLVISEGGTHGGHCITVARARGVWGPYEACPANPVLTATGTDEYVQYTGHCDIFKDGEGEWWGVCLGVRKDEAGRFVMGRESFLTRAGWEDGWPTLDRVKVRPRALEAGAAFSAAPGVDLVYIRDPDLGRYETSVDGAVTLTPSSTELSHQEDSPTFIGKRQRRLDGESSVTLHPAAPWADAGVRAGIAVYKDEHRYLSLVLDASSSEIVFELRNGAKEVERGERRAVGAGGVALRIEYTEKEYRLWYAVGAGEATCLGVVDTLEMTGPDFVGPVIGAFAVAKVEGVRVECTGLSVE